MSYLTLHPIPLKFLIHEENFVFFFYQCRLKKLNEFGRSIFPDKIRRGVRTTDSLVRTGEVHLNGPAPRRPLPYAVQR